MPSATDKLLPCVFRPDYWNSILQSEPYMQPFTHRMGHASDLVGAVWDSHHPHRMGETPAEVYANLGPRILLAQVKDARLTEDGDWRLVLLGAGEVPVRDMLRLLAAGSYPHWISVEWEKRWHPEIEDPEVALPQHLDLLTAWLESGP